MDAQDSIVADAQEIPALMTFPQQRPILYASNYLAMQRQISGDWQLPSSQNMTQADLPHGHPQARSTRLYLELRGLIHQAVAPWVPPSEQKPPYTLEEIVIMALVMKGSATMQEIQSWVFDNFGYYRRLAYRYVWRQALDRYQVEQLNYAFRNVFCAFEVPVQKVHGPSFGMKPATDIWRVPLGEAMIVLSKYFTFVPPSLTLGTLPASRFAGPAWPPEQDPPGDSRLFKLPPEIRTIIYDLVLGFPRSGIAIMDRSYMPGLSSRTDALFIKAVTRDYSKNATLGDWCPAGKEGYIPRCDYEDHLLTARPIKDLMAITMVNKQIRLESKDRFPAINHFTYTHCQQLRKFLDRAPKDFRDNIRKITLSYKPNECRDGRVALQAISKIHKLRELIIHIEELDWLMVRQRKGLPKYAGVMNIPGLRFLLGAKFVENVKFVGDCDGVRKVFADAVQAAKKKAAVRSGKAKSAQEKAGNVANKGMGKGMATAN